jgi:hypothetical protein
MRQAEVGTKVIFEHEPVKVWEVTLPTVCLRSGDASQGARNPGARRYHEVRVELKAPR